MSTCRRLSWCDRTDAQGGVDSPRSSRFEVVVRRRSSSSSYVQVGSRFRGSSYCEQCDGTGYW
jgi:hypothetical protein